MGACVVSADGVGAGDAPEASLMRTKAAMKALRGRGQWCGEIPMGFHLAVVGKTLLENPDERAAIHTARTLHEQGIYLERDEMKALLDVPRPSERFGLRASALLTLMYNTGARASEAVGLNIKDVRFETLPLVHILGKGRKQRTCPIWPETVEVLKAYLKQRNDGAHLDEPLFLNAQGNRLGRFGVVAILRRHIVAAARQQPSLTNKRISPHTLRHTAAMHMLQAGVEINVIKSWLGHVSVTTTNEYIEIDLAMKREAIERCTPPVPEPTGEIPWHSRQDIIDWLQDL